MNYPGLPIEFEKTVKDARIITVDDVERSYLDIPFRGDYLPIKSSTDLQNANVYNPLKAEEIELGKKARRLRHFQGIGRTTDGNYIVFSGGDNSAQAAQIFVCSIESNMKNGKAIFKDGRIGANLNYVYDTNPDKLNNIYAINETGLWHCGGISILDHILVAPVEGDDGSSQIRFIDMANPKKPKDMGDTIAIDRPKGKAGAASMIRLPNEKYLCAVFTDSEPDKKSKIEFYLSNSKKIKDGFDTSTRKVFPIQVQANHKRPRYQMIQLLLQSDGQIYFAGAENTNAIAPIPPGSGLNRSGLYKVSFAGQDVNDSGFKLVMPTVTKVGFNKPYGGGGNRYNFAAGTGIYVTPDKRLAMYACFHRMSKDGKELQCTEFYPRFKKGEITSNKDILIELYDDEFFKDRCMRLYGQKNTTIKDYSNIMVEGSQFNDKVSSIMFQIPKGMKYVLYKDANFEGKSMTLIGTGKRQEIKNMSKAINNSYCKMPKGFNDKISSSRFE